MRTLALSVVVTALALLAAVILYFSFATPAAPEAPPNLSEGRSAAELPVKSDSPASPRLEPAPVQPPTVAEQDSQRATIAPATAPEIAADKRCTLTVSVSMPKGVPADDETELFVLGKFDDETNVEFELARLRPGEAKPKWLLARAALGANADMEIALERGAGKVTVGLRGRYSFAEPELEVSIAGERAEATLAARLGACLRGRLVPPADATDLERELLGAKLEVKSDPMAATGMGGAVDASKLVHRSSACNADGSFEVRAIAAVKNLTLSGAPAHLAAFKLALAEPTPGKSLEVSVILTRGANATGRVVDASGAGIPDAKLSARMDAVIFGQGGRVVRETKSTADGAFTLEAVAAGKAMIDINADGFINKTQDLEFVEGGRVNDLVLTLDGGARIAGRVHWADGTPVAVAKVDVSFDQAHLNGMEALNAARGGKGSGSSDAQGNFSVSGLGKGPFSVKCSARPAGQDEAASEWTAQVDGVKPGTLDVELVLAPPSDVAGHVIDDQGAPVPECTVVLGSKRRNPYIPSEDSRDIEVRDEQGAFTAKGLRSGAYTALARDKAGASSKSVEFLLPMEASAAALVITLPRAATVTGRVLLPDGTPAANAKVARQMGIADLMGGKLPGSEASATAGEDGTFTMKSLPMGALLLAATKDGYATSEAVALTLAPAQQVADITITLRKGGTISGEVYGDDGKAKGGARILAQMPDLRFGQLWAQSDSSGKFEYLHVPPGQWQVMSFGEAMNADTTGDAENAAEAQSKLLKNMKIAMADVKDGKSVHIVLGAPPKNPVHVRALVTCAKEPVSGAMVSFIAKDGAKAGGGLGSLKMDSTDKSGRFELDLDHAGGYLVTVQKVGNAGSQQSIEFARDVPEAPEYSLELELPMGAILGRVTDGAGETVAGARISLGVDGPVRAGTLTGGRFSEVTTDERGEYSLDWLAPGRYTVSAGGMQFVGLPTAKEPLGREVRDGIEVAEGQRVDRVDFRLKAACELKGKVLDGDGKPVGEAAIFIRDEQGRPVERLSIISSDAGGNFVQKGLSSGRYTIHARSEGLVSGEEALAVLRDGETTEVALHVIKGTLLVLTITGAGGEAVEASCTVEDEKGRQVNNLISLAELMDAMGEGGFDSKLQRVGPLAPGKYKVTVTDADGKETTKSVTLLGQTERKLTIKLDK